MKKDFFNLLMSFRSKQPWILDQEEELNSLLYDECKTDDERNLIVELLKNFLYISPYDTSKLFIRLVHQIVSDTRLSSETTQLVAMSMDYSSDSAQFVLYGLKRELQRQKWERHITATNCGKSFSQFKKHNCVHTNIVLIDEFVGSGQTVIGRVNELKKQYALKNKNISIFVKTFIACESGINAAREQGIEIECFHVLKKGITDYNHPKAVTEKILLMDGLEKLLSKTYMDRNMPKRGYGETECLYFRDSGNTPNSVFPIFWWPRLINETERKTILYRAMGDA